MKTILITGGASGFGKGVAMHYLAQGDRVIAIGGSAANGKQFCKEAKTMGTGQRAIFMQADLSSIKENWRVIEEIKEHFPQLDMILFFAAKHSKTYTETKDGLELTFALDYLSRFVLSYGLKECLERAEHPAILNICGSGMKGDVNWDDLQHKTHFDAQKVMMHGSRLNDLSGVAFTQNNPGSKIKYILYNPWAVQTPGMMELYKNPIMKRIYKIIGKPIEKAVTPIAELLEHLPEARLSAYRERKKLDLNRPTYSQENAKQLYDMTIKLVIEMDKAYNKKSIKM